MDQQRRTPPTSGFATFALVATSLVGVIAMLTAFDPPIKEGKGMCLIAAALAFGLLSNALWRR